MTRGLQAVTYTVKVVVYRKLCKIETLLLQAIIGSDIWPIESLRFR